MNRSVLAEGFARKWAVRRTTPDLHRMDLSNASNLGDDVHEHVFASRILTAHVTVPPEALRWRVGTAAVPAASTGTTKARAAAPAKREQRTGLISDPRGQYLAECAPPM